MTDTVNSESGKKKRTGRAGLIAWITLGVLAVAAGGLYFTGWAMAGDTVPEGTSVEGVDISGLTRAAALEKLRSDLGARETAPITITGNGTSVEMKPVDMGLTADWEATVAKAGGRSWNPVDIWNALFGGGPVDLVLAKDDNTLTSALTIAAPKFASEAKSASITFVDAKPELTPGVDDSRLDVNATAAKVEQAWREHKTTAEAVLLSSPPSVTTDEARKVMAEYAQPAVAGPIHATTDKGTLSFTPEMIAVATTFTETGNTLVGETSADKLLEAIKPELAKLNLPAAKDASIAFSGGKPTVVPSVDGLSLDAATITKDVLPAVTKTGAERTVKMAFVKAVPAFTTEAATKLGVKEVTGEFTTYFPDTAYRNNNLPRATRALNGTLIKPGEVFSFNQVVGQRTAARGYMEGGAICPGQVICNQLGGGVSQVATTTYNAFFFSGLQHITHKPHSLYFSRYPAGREATIDWGNIDVSFKNDTPYGVYIQGIGIPGSNGRNGTVTIRIWSTKEYDVRSSNLVRSNYTSGKTIESTAADCKPQSGQQGFDVNYKRLWYKDGKLVKSEPYFWRYSFQDKIVCKSPTPTPTPSR